ncbi:MAG: alpha/beta hydrolase [Wenzhouxiangella sp.]|nr:MAG: alpha/beta hydrolase [Wenzhouxiangella sp.]
MRRILTLILLPLTLVSGATWWAYHRDLRDLHAHLSGSATIARTAFGPVSYASGGDGMPLLAIHGAGGGHDQGRLLAEAFAPEGYRWIAPSRFGYPGSPMPDKASTEAQADAFAALIDSLGVEQVTVIAMSGGVPPALHFARRHPQRTRALILISLAPFAPLGAEEQELPVPLWLYNTLFASDFPLWAVLRLAPRRLAPMFDARDDLKDQTTESEAAFVQAMMFAFLPATLRRAGLANEGAAIDPAATIDPAMILVPTLVIHARDDRITPFSTAGFAAEQIPGAQLFELETGGHLLLGHHDTVRQRIAEFLEPLERAQTLQPPPLKKDLTDDHVQDHPDRQSYETPTSPANQQ